MEGYEDTIEVMKALKQIRKMENLKMTLMSREELIQYIVYQMDYIEDKAPEMTKPFDGGFQKDYKW